MMRRLRDACRIIITDIEQKDGSNASKRWEG